MKKQIFFIILIAFVLVSCEEVYIDDNDSFCKIDKNVYFENEPIQVSIIGTFSINDEVSGLQIELDLYNTENDSSESNMMILTEKDNILWNYSSSYGYIYFARSDENCNYLTDFDDKITIAIPKAGSYRLNVSLRSGSKKRRYGGLKSFDNNLTILSSE
ncbi:MAG: hypothetical protein IK102_08935 [Treponema sp.]|nr:hypothetical protein [Treponema sp.]